MRHRSRAHIRIVHIHLNGALIRQRNPVVPVVHLELQILRRTPVKVRRNARIHTHRNASIALQIALLLTPVLILLSQVVGPHQLTLVFPPLLVASLAVAAVLVVIVVSDGEYTWLEGIALIAVYGIIATAFWWG